MEVFDARQHAAPQDVCFAILSGMTRKVHQLAAARCPEGKVEGSRGAVWSLRRLVLGGVFKHMQAMSSACSPMKRTPTV